MKELMKEICLIFLLFISFHSDSNSQIIIVNPPEPNVNDDITLIYDATQGSGGLVGVNQVYMHTGLITDKSNNSTDWKYVVSDWGVDDPKVKMTNIGDNMHQISYNIKSYYGVPATETVLKLAYVFRNVDGTKEGKTEDGSDIFYEVFPDPDAFTSTFVTPNVSNLFVRPGQVLPIQVQTSFVSNIQLFINDELLKAETTDLLNYTLFINNQTGTNVIKYVAQHENQVLQDSFYMTQVPTTIIEELPNGSELGVNALDDQTVRFNIEAPNKSFVYLLGDFNEWQLSDQYLLKNTTDKQNWWMDLPGLDPTKEYCYQYAVDGVIRIADPYCTKLIIPFHDQFITPDIYPDLKPYPGDKTYGHVGTFKIEQAIFNWEDEEFESPDKEDLVIYELLVRDFAEENIFKTVQDSLPYFEKLGINAIELMPVNEFRGNINWGYDPEYHMALDKAYGTVADFKSLINEAHKRGIAIILDVVYNQASGDNPLAAMYWDSSNSKPSPENPWFNVDATHPFSVWNDMNHESEATRRYIKKIMKYWIEEFHIDGFRFDLSKGFTQTNSGDDVGFWGQYDASRITTLKQYADFIWSFAPEFYVILEHFAVNEEEIELSDYGMMIWGNSNIEYADAAMGYHENGKSDFSWKVSYKERGWNNPYLIGYMESHDEERMMYRALTYGNSSGDYDVTNLLTALQRAELATSFFFTVPGPKMLFQFGEYGYDLSLFHCVNGSPNEGCKLDPKPILWDYLEESARKRLFEIYSTLISLKNNYPTFSTDDFTIDARNEVKLIHLNHQEMDAVVLGNFDVVEQSVVPNFQHTGTWYEYFTGDELEVNATDTPIDFKPGEYRLYTDLELETPDITSSTLDIVSANKLEVKLIPNPNIGQFKVLVNSNLNENASWYIYDIQGVNLLSGKVILEGNIQIVEMNQIKRLRPGTYFFKLLGESGIAVEKLIVH